MRSYMRTNRRLLDTATQHYNSIAEPNDQHLSYCTKCIAEKGDFQRRRGWRAIDAALSNPACNQSVKMLEKSMKRRRDQ